MLYAVVGIPLTLLTITNLGGFMATVFRWFYKNVISGVCCCTHCDAPSGEAKRRKAAAAAAAAAVEATRTVKTVGRKVARSYASWPPTAQSPAEYYSPAAATAADTFTSHASNQSSSSRQSSVSTVRPYCYSYYYYYYSGNLYSALSPRTKSAMQAEYDTIRYIICTEKLTGKLPV